MSVKGQGIVLDFRTHDMFPLQRATDGGSNKKVMR